MVIRRRFSRRPMVRSRRRRDLVWGRFDQGATVLAGPTVTAFTPLGQLETDLGGDLQGATILRIVGRGLVHLTPATTAATNVQYIMGVSMATPAGSTANRLDAGQPGSNFDWMWYRAGHVSATGTLVGSASSLSYGSAVDRFEIDIRSKRKFTDIATSCQFWFQNSAAATDSLTYAVSLDFLVARP